MLAILDNLAVVVFILLSFLVIRSIQRAGQSKEYSTLFVYVSFSSLCSIVLAVYGVAPQLLFSNRREFVRFYWASEVLIELLVLLVCLTLIHFSAEQIRHRFAITSMVGVFSLLATLISVLVVVPWDSPTYTPFMTRLASNLTLCTALLNLILWMLLIRKQVKDLQLLLVSGGLGILTTGKAIGHSLRSMASPQGDRSLVELGNWIVTLTGLFCLFIWWQALKRRKERRRMEFAAQGVPESS